MCGGGGVLILHGLMLPSSQSISRNQLLYRFKKDYFIKFTIVFFYTPAPICLSLVTSTNDNL